MNGKSIFKIFALIFLVCHLILVLPVLPAQGAAKSESKSDEGYKPFADVTKDTEKTSGLFNLYQTKEGQVYLEVQPDQLDKPILLTMTLSTGIGQDGILSGTPIDNFIIKLQQVNDEIQVIQINPYFKANEGTSLEQVVDSNFSGSLTGSLKILSIHPETKSFLTDATDFFLSDASGIVKIMNQNLKGNYSLNVPGSFFKNVASFPENSEVETSLNFSTATPPKESYTLTSLPDWRNISLGVHYSLSVIPEDAYVPRYGDDRVGYFMTSFKDFSSHDPDSPVTRYINRWNINKKPIVFWIEKTVPREYRQIIQEAILEWNKAFAAIGIPNMVDVKIQPDDATWNAWDVRYNMIRWIASSEGSFAATGPSRVNPLTGEIFNANVIIDGEAIRDIRFIYVNELDLRIHTNGHVINSRTCSLPSLKAKDAMIGGLSLALLGNSFQGNVNVPDWFIKDYLKDLVMHEVGHCFGLRHNFHASTLLSLKEINEPNITQKTGLAASVMDYLPVNISIAGEKQGEYFSSTIGPYDYWAIAYGYTPFKANQPDDETNQLRRIASQSSARAYAYSTDEDILTPYRLDPHSAMFDLSSDSLAYAIQRFKLYHELWQAMDLKLPLEGKSFNKLRHVFELIMKAYQNVTMIPARYIGGEYFSRDHRGAAHGEPLKPVDKKTQLRALEILEDYVFAEHAFSFSPNFLNKLSSNRNYDHFSETQVFLTPLNYPILEDISDIQENSLAYFFQPVVMARLLNNEKAVSKNDQTLSLGELFEWMTVHFWQELESGQSISSTRRNLQRAYLEHLAKLVIAPKPQVFSNPDLDLSPTPIASVPDDARNLAEYQLVTLKNKLQKALKSKRYQVDSLTYAHLSSSFRLIKQVLSGKTRPPLKYDVPVGESE